MFYIGTERAIGHACKRCGETIEFPAFEVNGLEFCTIQCAFDYAAQNPQNFDSPDIMTRRPFVAYG